MASAIAVLIQHTLALAIVNFFPIYQIPKKIDHSTVIDHPHLHSIYLTIIHRCRWLSLPFVEILSYIGP